MTSAEPQPETAEVVLYRILGVRDDYLSSRPAGPGDHELVIADSPTAGDTTRVLVGGRPDEYTAAWRQTYALLIAALKYPAEWRDAEDVVQARDDFVDRLAGEVDLPEELLEECGLWVTVRISRPCLVDPASHGRYFWARYTQVKAISESFVAEVEDHLDLVMALIEAELGVALTVPVVTSDRPFFFVQGRAPFALPVTRFPQGSVSTTKPWTEIDPAPLRDGLRRAGDALPGPIRHKIAAAYRWLVLSEGDEDTLRSFLFAFLGVEALAQGVSDLLLPAAKAQLVAAPDHRLPLDDLIWPRPREGDDTQPYRNAVYHFAVLATALNPSSAADDVAEFRVFNSNRQRIAHGKDHKLDAFPTSECQALLRRYVRLVTTHDWDNS